MKKPTYNRKNFLRVISTLDNMKKNLRMILLFLIMASLSCAAYGGHGILDFVDPSFNPQVQTNLFNHKRVHAIQVLPDGKILVLGFYTSYNRMPVGKLVRLNSDGSLDPTFNNQTVTNVDSIAGGTRILLQPDGKIILVGLDILISGQSAPKNLVRLNSDGTFDAGFNYAVGGVIQDIALDSAGRIALAGSFQTSQGARHVIRLNGNGSLDASFNFTPGGSPVFEAKIAAQGSRLIVAVFITGNQIYRLNEDGSADPSFTPAVLGGMRVNQIIVQPDNKILYLTSQTIRRLNENGGDDGSFQPPTFTLRGDGSIILAGDGKIVLALGSSSSLFRRFLPNGADDLSFSQYTHPAYTSFTVQSDSHIVIGDMFLPSPNPINHFIRLTPAGTPDPAFNAGGIGFQVITPGNVRAIETQPDGKILLGGKFDAVNDILRAKIARLNADSTLDTSFQTNTSGSGNRFSRLAEFYHIRAQNDGKIVVSGDFDYVLNGVTKSNLVRLNSDGSIDATFNLTQLIPDVSVASRGATNKIAPFSDGKLMVGTSKNTFAQLIAPLKLTAGGARDNSFNPTINSQSDSLHIDDVAIQPDGKILIGGSHSPPGGNDRNFTARLNADGSTDPTFLYSEEPNRLRVTLVLLPNGKILVGKRLLYPGISFGSVQRLNSDGTPDASFNSLSIEGGTINALLALPNGKIFVGGRFTVSVSGQQSKNLLQLSADGNFEPTTYNFNEEVLCLAVDGEGRVLVGGGFTVINTNGGNTNRSYVARLIDARTQFDFDGDGRADQAVFRPSNSVWHLFGSQSGFSAAQFGLPTDKLTPADFDGDGRTDISVFRDGTWYWLNSSTGSFQAAQFGQAGDVPVPADYTGDGRAELAVYRLGIWYTLNLANNQFQAVQFGIASDKPVPADFDGDGKTDFAVYRGGFWYILGSSQGFAAVKFGIETDKPVVGDYDGDGRADQAVYREGIWYILGSTQGFYAAQFGITTDVPVPADYDGDGRADIAVFRDGVWYLLGSQQGFGAVQFGTINDRPISAAFVP
jgi:uncharacterized delta-60 repeat protein